MLQLKVFGGLSLTRDGRPLGGAAAQPRRLAILAALAVAGDQGLTRDKLIGLLWPDTDEARARQALSQSLYALRKDTGAEDLVTGTTVLRLASDTVETDLAAFESARLRDDRQAMAVLYSGPFLDGVYISGAPDFEHWVDAERLRLGQVAEQAIETLATEAETRGDHGGAARWWRRLSVLDPLQTRAALGLMSAAAASGDRAEALRHGHAYHKRVREELGVDPNPRIAQLIESLRGSSDDGTRAIGDRYVVERELGRGGMAVVFLARDRKHDRHVALKMLHREFGTLIGRERLEREILVTAALQHPHILPLYDSGEFDDTLYYVMPFVDGESLRGRLLREQQLPVEDAVHLAIEIAGALDHAHRHGVVHRDVKPENILLADGHAIVADFGIAKAAHVGLTKADTQEALTHAGIAIGTPAYMSPEQVVGDGDVGPASDVFSLACVLYEMLSGRPPWIGGSSTALMAKRFSEDPPELGQLRQDVPPALASAIRNALARDPAERTGSAAAFAEALKSGGRVEPAIQLPTLTGSMIGRERELSTTRALLERRDVKLLTLTGPGGTGKTRLAAHLARAAAETFDAAWFVDLSAVSDPTGVLPAIAERIGIRDAGHGDVVDVIASHIRGRRTLLVIDNFEQVIAAAPQVGRLIARVEELTVLATSRVRLGLRGEHEFFVAPLALPEEGVAEAQVRETAAVQLFELRAREAQPGFTLDDETAGIVARICIRVDGLPLAIELAAARCRVLSPRAVLQRLEKNFEILSGGARDLPERHRTMRQTIAWSYELLAPEHQALFAQLAVFAGGCTLEAAEHVCGGEGIDVLGGVEALLDASLLLRDDSGGGEPRLRMLEAIREFALDMLRANGTLDAVSRRHTAWAVELATATAPKLVGKEQGEALAVLARERSNLHLALERAIAARDASVALRLAAQLWRYWLIRSRLSDALTMLDAALALPADDSLAAVRADVLTGAGQIAQNSGAVRVAERFFLSGLEIRRALSDEHGIARALADLGWVAWRTCEYEESRRRSAECLTLSERIEDERTAALALGNLGFAALCQGDFSDAISAFERSRALREGFNDARGVAFMQVALAWAYTRMNDGSAALRVLEPALDTFSRIADHRLEAFALNIRAEVHLRSGEPQAARQILDTRTIDTVRRIADRWAIAHALGLRAWAAQLEGDLDLAERIAKESFELRVAVEDRWGMAELLALQGAVARARGKDEDAAMHYARSRELRAAIGDRPGLAECDRALADIRQATPA